MKKTFKVRDESGKLVDLDPSTLKMGKIKHFSLPDEFLAKVRAAYDVLREVITFNDTHLSLEQFELFFMREDNYEASLTTWQKIGLAFRKACNYFPDDNYHHKQIYHWLILLVMGAVDGEDLKKDEVQTISRCVTAANIIHV